MEHERILTERLREAGYNARSVERAMGGAVAIAGLVTLEDGSQLFAKTLLDLDHGHDVFDVESDGLAALRDAGAHTPDVLLATPRLLVLEKREPRRDDAAFWERLAHAVAALHANVGDRFGWHRQGWLGRLRQDNTWERDGNVFFAERRILRWLAEPLVDAEFDREERDALERLCAALPELIPPQPPCLNHGDLWQENILATADGEPVLIDPAVHYGWPESELSMLWCAVRPPASERFFDVYREVAGLEDGWEERLAILHLRELLSVIAHDDDAEGGAARGVREVIKPFLRRG